MSWGVGDGVSTDWGFLVASLPITVTKDLGKKRAEKKIFWIIVSESLVHMVGHAITGASACSNQLAAAYGWFPQTQPDC